MSIFTAPRLVPTVCLLVLLLPGHGRAETLADALRATLANHPAAAGQAARVDAKGYAVDEARSQRYPTLSAQAAQYATGNRRVATGEDLSQPVALRLRQPLWAFGRISSSIAVADAEQRTEQADLLRVQRALLEDTAVTYALSLGAHRQIEVARQNVAEHEALLAQIQRRVQGQLASGADERLAMSRLVQARARLERALSEWQGALNDLAALTRVSMTADQPVPAHLLELPGDDQLLMLAYENSADVRIRREALRQAEAELKQARSVSMPTLYLQADKFWDQPGVQDDGQVSLVLEASLDGMGFAARGRRGEADANRAAAAQELTAARVEIAQTLDQLLRNQRLQKELATLQSQSLTELESLLASYQRQYESGTKSWLDLMNIQRELYEERRLLVQAESDQTIYSLTIQARTGGLDSLAGLEADTGD